MGTLCCDAVCWEPSCSMMLALYVLYSWDTSLPTPDYEDQLFSPLLPGSSGKTWGSVLYIQEPGVSSVHWRRLIPEEGQSLCRAIYLAVSFCPCYCSYCVFPSEKRTEVPNFVWTTDCAALLHFFFLAFSFLPCPQTQECKVSKGPSVPVFQQPSVEVLHNVWPELHVSVLSLDAIVGACVCIRKSHKWFQYISKTVVLRTVLTNKVQKDPGRQTSNSWYIYKDWFISVFQILQP